MARIYSNENLYLPVVIKLRELGHDVLTSFDAGRANQKIPDEEVLAFAISEKRCVLTLNRRHFIRLHFEDKTHFGIIVCTEDKDFDGLAKRIHQAIETLKGELEGKLVRIYRPNP